MTEQNANPPPRTDSHSAPAETRTVLHRAVLVDGIGVLFLLGLAAVWYAANVLLLVFACILFATLLYELSSLVQRRLPIPHRLALALVVLLLLGLLGIGGELMAPQLSEQASRLATEVPESLQRLRTALEHNRFLHSLLAGLPSMDQLRNYLATLVPHAGLVFTGLLGVVGNIVIIAVAGIYFAAQPYLYIDGLVTLIPKGRRQRAREVLNEIGRTLGKWLIGKLCSMVIIGTMTAVGLSLLGVPLALILGIITGLLNFIPYLGALIGFIPALLIAFSVSLDLALYTMLLLIAVHLVEGYLVSPLIEARTVSLPPALTIVMQLLFGTLFGLAGVALATPLTAVLAVLVSMLYVQDVLGDPVRTPADHPQLR
jgi:predicted PurR-regulated permease PerM